MKNPKPVSKKSPMIRDEERCQSPDEPCELERKYHELKALERNEIAIQQGHPLMPDTLSVVHKNGEIIIRSWRGSSHGATLRMSIAEFKARLGLEEV